MAEDKYDIVQVSTTFGNIYIWLYDETPKHKENFIKLAKEGFYNGTTFHRIIDGFMIQGGDPNSKDDNPHNDGQGGPGYQIDAEFIPALKHIQGAVAAARTNNPAKRSSGSQFYIVEPDKGAHFLDNQYTVFGQVIKGIEAVETIAVQPKDGRDRPIDNIPMEVKVVEYTASKLKKEFGFEVPQ